MKSNRTLKYFLAFLFLTLLTMPSYSADTIEIGTWAQLSNIKNDLSADYILINDLDEFSPGYDDYVTNAENGAGWIPIGEFVPAAAIGDLVEGEWDADGLRSTPFTGSFDGGGFTISGLYMNRPDEFGVGLFGYIRNGSIRNLKLINMNVVGHRHVGGVAGYVAMALIENVQTNGKVYANHNGGGVAGTLREGSIVRRSGSSAHVEGFVINRRSLRTGGLIGAVHGSSVEECWTSGRVDGNYFDTGGLAGSTYEGSQILRSYTVGPVFGTGAVGALIGSTNQATVIEDCYATGNVTATSREVGGLVGNTNYGTRVINSYATGDVSGNGSWVGGLVGIVCNRSSIEKSYATGNVKNNGVFTGGLVGLLSTGASISDSYATGNAAGNGGVGGLAGSLFGLSDEGVIMGATVERCYSTGSAAGPYAVGGLIGAVTEGEVVDSYWDLSTSGLGESAGGTGLITMDLLSRNSFKNFDFEAVWNIEEGNSYPFLRMQQSQNIPYPKKIIAISDYSLIQQASINNLLDVLSNDLKPEGTVLVLETVTQGRQGVVEISGNQVSYIPNEGARGGDSFYYTAGDGIGGYGTGVVIIVINRPPVAQNDAAVIIENSADNIIEVLNNDSDPDSNTEVLTISEVSQGSNGSVTFTNTEVTYTPNPGFYGEDTFTYTISDTRGGTAIGTVVISVTKINEPPVAVDDQATVNQNTNGNLIDVLANDTDPEDDALTLVSVTAPAHGSAIVTNNKVSYTPSSGYTGTDSIEYTISDGQGGTDTASVNITVRYVSSGGGGTFTVPIVPVIEIETYNESGFTLNSTKITTTLLEDIALANIGSNVIDALINKAIQTQATEKDDILEIAANISGMANGIQFKLQSADLLKLVSAAKSSLRLTTQLISFTIDAQALKSINESSGQGEFTLSGRQMKHGEFSEEELLLIKDRPVYELKAMKGSTPIHDFGAGEIKIDIPYTLKSNENPNAIVVYLLTENGTLEYVMGRYDSVKKAVVLTTSHFSEFVIGYNPVSFADVPDQAWFKNAVTFVAARGIAAGTGEGRFEPESDLKRGDFVLLLMNTYGSDIAKLKKASVIENFADAGNTYYTERLWLARQLGLIDGTGNNLFEPELAITRQEMMVMLYKVLKAIDRLPVKMTQINISGYDDGKQVAAWAEEAIDTFLNSGVVIGYSNRLTPEAKIIRAEVAQILYNLIDR